MVEARDAAKLEPSGLRAVLLRGRRNVTRWDLLALLNIAGVSVENILTQRGVVDPWLHDGLPPARR